MFQGGRSGFFVCGKYGDGSWMSGGAGGCLSAVQVCLGLRLKVFTSSRPADTGPRLGEVKQTIIFAVAMQENSEILQMPHAPGAISAQTDLFRQGADEKRHVRVFSKNPAVNPLNVPAVFCIVSQYERHSGHKPGHGRCEAVVQAGPIFSIYNNV